jgi:hypothetical protein
LELQLKGAGQYVKVTSDGPSIPLEKYESIAMSDPRIESFSWVSTGLDYITDVNHVTASNIGKLANERVMLFGVSPNIFDSLLKDFLIVGGYNPQVKFSKSLKIKK